MRETLCVCKGGVVAEQNYVFITSKISCKNATKLIMDHEPRDKARLLLHETKESTIQDNMGCSVEEFNQRQGVYFFRETYIYRPSIYWVCTAVAPSTDSDTHSLHNQPLSQQ